MGGLVPVLLMVLEPCMGRIDADLLHLPCQQATVSVRFSEVSQCTIILLEEVGQVLERNITVDVPA